MIARVWKNNSSFLLTIPHNEAKAMKLRVGQLVKAKISKIGDDEECGKTLATCG